jgi:hypothetical protein
MTEPGRGGIFISYRREETAPYAGRLYDRLSDEFGEEQIFMDIDSISPGLDFVESITRAVSACRVLLALIGTEWLSATDTEGNRRIDDEQDFVRLEIETALKRDIRVIPILVNGAELPHIEQLPSSLHALARRQALQVRHESFRPIVNQLIEDLRLLYFSKMASQEKTTSLSREGSSGLASKAPPGNTWRAELEERTRFIRTVVVHLDETTTRIRVSNVPSPASGIYRDDSKLNSDVAGKTVDTIEDGGQVRRLEVFVRVGGVMWSKFHTVRISVDGRTLYEELN